MKTPKNLPLFICLLASILFMMPCQAKEKDFPTKNSKASIYTTTLQSNGTIIIGELFTFTSPATRNYILLITLFMALYFAQRNRERKNREVLNLEIAHLTTKHKELSEKYKHALAGGDDKTTESQEQRLLKKAIELIESNISDPLFGVEKMAREMGMSRTNMHRKIKAISGLSPSELIRNVRLKKAAQLLLKQVDSVAQISFAVGFEDHSYFSKSFKKQFGVPPSEYSQSVDRAANTSGS